MGDEEKKPAEPEGEVRMTFGEHLEELQSRLLKSIVVLLLVIVGLMFFYRTVAEIITRPHWKAMLMLDKDPNEVSLLPEGYQSPLLGLLKLTFIAGLFICSPWVGYQMWAFVAAGLFKREKKYVVRFAPISFALFTAGCAFGYFALIPYALYGLASMMDITLTQTLTGPDGVSVVVEHPLLKPMYSFPAYLNLVMLLTIILGAVFQMPLVMVFLAKIGLVHPSTYNKWRRGAIIGNVVFAAIITPADVFTLVAVAAPMLILYEIGVIVSYLVVRTPKPETS